jgi:hypothetical protein
MAYIDPTIAALYRDRRRSLKTAFDTAFGAQEQQAGAQIQALGGQYNALRNQAYTTARVAALGNNEMLAAQGLAGAAYAAPQSGYSETSRANQDIALGNALNALTLQQQGTVNDINTQMAAGRLQKDVEWLNADSGLLAEEQQAQTQAHQLALQKAQQEVQMFGRVMTAEAARVLGVPIGTRMRTAGGGGSRPQQSGMTADQYAQLLNYLMTPAAGAAATSRLNADPGARARGIEKMQENDLTVSGWR